MCPVLHGQAHGSMVFLSDPYSGRLVLLDQAKRALGKDLARCVCGEKARPDKPEVAGE